MQRCSTARLVLVVAWMIPATATAQEPAFPWKSGDPPRDVAGLSLRDSRARLDSVMGEPESVQDLGSGLYFFGYRGGSVIVGYAELDGIAIIHLRTRDAGEIGGVRVGDSLSSVLERWGAPRAGDGLVSLYIVDWWVVAVHADQSAERVAMVGLGITEESLGITPDSGVSYFRPERPWPFPFTQAENADGARFIWFAFSFGGFPYDYVPTASLPDHPRFRAITDPRAGDVAWWPEYVALVADSSTVLTAEGPLPLQELTERFGTPTYFRHQVPRDEEGAGPAVKQAITIPDEPVCQNCQIRLEKGVSIGDVDGPGALPGEPWAVTKTSDRIIVTAGYNPTELLVFDWEGAFVQAIGREGDGPGEYNSAIAVVVMHGDTIVVFDRGLGRQTVLSPSFEVIAAFGIQVHPTRAWPLDSRTILVNGISLSRVSRAGTPQPLHLLQLDGTITDSFGAERIEQLMQIYGPHPVLFARVATPMPDGTFWNAPHNEYRMELRAQDGSVIRAVRRQPGWFPPWEIQPEVSPDQPPLPWLAGIAATPEGDLIALINVPADDWREAIEEWRPWPGGPKSYRWDTLRAYDTVVEVLDPEAAQLVATREIAFLVQGFLDDETVYAYAEDELGNPRIDLYRLVLEK